VRGGRRCTPITATRPTPACTACGCTASPCASWAPSRRPRRGPSCCSWARVSAGRSARRRCCGRRRRCSARGWALGVHPTLRGTRVCSMRLAACRSGRGSCRRASVCRLWGYGAACTERAGSATQGPGDIVHWLARAAYQKWCSAERRVRVLLCTAQCARLCAVGWARSAAAHVGRGRVPKVIRQTSCLLLNDRTAAKAQILARDAVCFGCVFSEHGADFCRACCMLMILWWRTLA